eukprot:snap_masked-scaffold_74-processed-gene-0.61-mRNA-1 protein AED:1.00 eAED:1.00 QI:0/0/0/0/1/1/2/0/491
MSRRDVRSFKLEPIPEGSRQRYTKKRKIPVKQRKVDPGKKYPAKKRTQSLSSIGIQRSSSNVSSSSQRSYVDLMKYFGIHLDNNKDDEKDKKDDTFGNRFFFTRWFLYLLEKVIEKIHKLKNYIIQTIKAAIRRLLILTVVSLCFFFSIFLYLVIYYYNIPTILFQAPVYLDFKTDSISLCNRTNFCPSIKDFHGPVAFVDLVKKDSQFETFTISEISSRKHKPKLKMKPFPKTKGKKRKSNSSRPKMKKKSINTQNKEKKTLEIKDEFDHVRFLEAMEKYHVELEILFRPNEDNYKASNFMVTANLLNGRKSVLAYSKRPSILPTQKAFIDHELENNALKSLTYYIMVKLYYFIRTQIELLLYIMSFFNPFSYLWYFLKQICFLCGSDENEFGEKISITLFEEYEEKKKYLEACRFIHLEISEPNLSVIEAKINFHALLKPFTLRYFAYYYRYTTFIIYMISAMWLEVSTTMISSIVLFFLYQSNEDPSL